MAQWLRVRLPMQGTRVRGPVWEDPYMLQSGWAREPMAAELARPGATTGEATTVRGLRTGKTKKNVNLLMPKLIITF